MNQYTVWIRCHLRGSVSEYKITMESKTSVMRFFKRTPDDLLEIRTGWGCFALWGRDLLGVRSVPFVPPFERGPGTLWVEPPEYDWRLEENFY